MKIRKGYNPKRAIALLESCSLQEWNVLADRVVYKGNPEHKLYPNDYGLTPATSPRPAKTLCDSERVLPKAYAETLLKSGVRKGIVSQRFLNGWPKNIWAIDDSGKVFEAQLENNLQGHYHGYPIPIDDDFRIKVLSAWGQR